MDLFQEQFSHNTAQYIFRLQDLCRALEKSKNQAYRERNQVVAALTRLFPSSIEKHEGEDWGEWNNVVYISIPSGDMSGFGSSVQISWHIHDSELPLFEHLPRNQGLNKWDGHDVAEKYRRLSLLCK